MSRTIVRLLLIAILLLSISSAIPALAYGDAWPRAIPASTTPQAPLLDNLGDHHHPISTQFPLAQRYFDQGLILAYGFNHAEAARSFRQAAALDPNCAICHWGIAFVLGPNINAGMDPSALPEAEHAIQTAIALSHHATQQEQAYIQALATRYPADGRRDRTQLDRDFATAMRTVAQRYPEDWDAATIFAEALMDTSPWDYWGADGSPKPEAVEILATLERVLAHQPQHPGANHLYIHAVEAQRPELGIAAADRLGELVPGAGHLVHMPSHIYIRVGRYHDAVVANQKAIEADTDYITQCHAQGIYPLSYMPHNAHFLMAAAMFAGEGRVALEAAHQTAEMVDQTLMFQPGYGTLQHYFIMPLYAMARFRQWDQILATPNPAPDLLYPTGIWHFVRGLAYTATEQISAAQLEWEAVDAIASNPELSSVTLWDINSTAEIMQIARVVLAGTIAASEGHYKMAIPYLQQAVTIEDALTYDEPPSWYSPTRQTLGQILLQADCPNEAEAVFRADLAKYPQNGWSLSGLAQSLEAQGKSANAKAIQLQLHQVWQFADIKG